MLAFRNDITEDIWVAYMFHSPVDCGGEGKDWQTIGWFHISPGATVTVYANDLGDVHNRFWYFYAENAPRTVIWTGPIGVYVTVEAFNHCFGIGTTTSRVVGFRVLDVGDNGSVILPLG